MSWGQQCWEAFKREQKQLLIKQEVIKDAAATAAACSSVPSTSAGAASLSTAPKQEEQVQLQEQQQSSSGRSTPNISDPLSASRIFVGGLSHQTSYESLRQYFATFGTVIHAIIMKDYLTQKSRGFGFITFSDPKTVEKVLEVSTHTLDGKRIEAKPVRPKIWPIHRNPIRSRKIFVGGISQDTTSEDVEAYFGRFGKVEETMVLMDHQTKRNRGFAFVTFESERLADRICEIRFHAINDKVVECKGAHPKMAVLSGLGAGPQRMAARASVTPASSLVPAQAQVQAAASAVGLASYRYAPYPMSAHTQAPYPMSAHTQAPYPMSAHTQAPYPMWAHTQAPYPMSAHTQATFPPAHDPQVYQFYRHFQGVEWGSMYGMGT